jgi:hypothetical protein
MIDRLLCGWRVRSDLPLPELPPWTGDDRPPELTIRLGTVPARQKTALYDAPLHQLGHDGCCRVEIPGLAAYLVNTDGREVVVDPHLAPNAAELRVFLFGPVLSILCHRRGVLPLHASCVRLGGRAVAFTGPTAAGKSVLAALFHRLGHEVLADDLTVVDMAAAGGPMVLPSVPGIMLWRDALNHLGYAAEGLERGRSGLEKYRLPPADPSTAASAPLPLAAIYRLNEARDPRHERLARLRGVEAVMSVNEAVHAVRLGRRLNGGAALFTRVTHLAGAVPVYEMARPLTILRNEAVVAELAALYAPAESLA